jgi:hypothetical protein
MMPIKILDATEDDFGVPCHHFELQYAAAEAKKPFFRSLIPALGVIRGLICPECGQVKLYGETRSKK